MFLYEIKDKILILEYMAELMGLEPTTFRVTGGRSNQTELQLQNSNYR